MKKRYLMIVLILAAITALIAGFYLKGRSQAPEGNLAIVCDGSETLVDPFSAPVSEVKGTTVNGKGQEKEISAQGAALSDVLSLAGIEPDSYTTARVVSSDEYAAEITAEEAAAGNIAFLIPDEGDDGTETIRLIVFGDDNSKRQVKDVVKIEVIK